ncbi:DUF1168 domain protein [Morchella snyderi]|nr:DUF1168 domain protein [Morchella snyderi]
MSEPIPESIPTSHDRRSKRPTKRRALSPVSFQASAVTSLFAKPDREIILPRGPKAKTLPPPPEIVANVQGSSAGAGSGEFHVYKAARRREYERIRLMEEEVKRENDEKEFLEKTEELKKKDDERTEKNRKKRMKKKQKGKGGKADVEMKDESKDTNGSTANGKPNESSNGTAIKENTNGINASGMKVQERSSTPVEYKEGNGLIIHDESD